MTVTIGGKPGLLKMEQVAEWVNCSIRTIRRYIAMGKFPKPLKVGQIARWRPEDIEKWVSDRCQDAKPAR